MAIIGTVSTRSLNLTTDHQLNEPFIASGTPAKRGRLLISQFSPAKKIKRDTDFDLDVDDWADEDTGHAEDIDDNMTILATRDTQSAVVEGRPAPSPFTPWHDSQHYGLNTKKKGKVSFEPKVDMFDRATGSSLPLANGQFENAEKDDESSGEEDGTVHPRVKAKYGAGFSTTAARRGGGEVIPGSVPAYREIYRISVQVVQGYGPVVSIVLQSHAG